MSKGVWTRCPISGISMAKLEQTDFLSAGREFKTWLFPDCDVFDERSIAALAGFGERIDNFKARALAPGSSYFHLHPLTDDDGRVLGYATHTTSAGAGAAAYRGAAKARQAAGKRLVGL